MSPLKIGLDVAMRYRLLHGGKPFPNRESWVAAVKREMERRGMTPIQAKFDPANRRCTVCGRLEMPDGISMVCPGWHVEAEGAKPKQVEIPL